MSSDQISQNYQKTLKLAAELLEDNLKTRGRMIDEQHPDFIDIVQSAAGHPQMVQLIQSTLYEEQIYTGLLMQVLDSVKSELFPDVYKRRYISFEKIAGILSSQNETDPIDAAGHDDEGGKKILTTIKDHLDKDSLDYLENKLLSNRPDLAEKVIRLTGNKNINTADLQYIKQRINLFKKHFPDGNVQIDANIDTANQLSGEQVVLTYLNVYLGIEKRLPKNFFNFNGKQRAAILTRYLIERVLHTTPEQVLQQKDELLFVKYKLQSIYRLFNYSVNRVLRNAYPHIIPTWLNSRTDRHYWDKKVNRIEAVRWLVEYKLDLDPDRLFESSVTRKDFAGNGLSYVFNQYYNSVGKALSEAYPDLMPWETGKVPRDYWNEVTAVKAVKWLIQKKGWQVDELPYKIKSKQLTRKTFSEYGLTTVFETYYNKNLCQAISAAWPGKFEPWELGKVSADYWKDVKNIKTASHWVAAQEGIKKEDITQSVRQKRLTFHKLKKYSIGQALKRISRGNIENLFPALFWKDQKLFREEERIVKKVNQNRLRQLKSDLLSILLYGFNYSEMVRNNQRQNAPYRRITRRIRWRDYWRQ